jgi:hypothetical protein
MRIIHYTLGFSPYRSGGLVKYAKDLMVAQADLGHSVVALYPGGTELLHKLCYVHEDIAYESIRTFEMSNPLPVSLMYGIKDVERETSGQGLDEKSFLAMLDEVKPDVLHVHTLMGLPLEYLRIVHDRNIRIVYTSHDYFGLCPKVNFINHNGNVCEGTSCERCEVCNVNAKSALFLKVRNAKWVVPLKKIARRMKK